MTTLTLQVREFLEENHQDTIQFIAAKLYESGKLTLGQAAEMTGLKKWDFAAQMADYNVYFLDESAAAAIEDAKGLI